MNSNLTVRLIADTNDIPVMYKVVEMTTGLAAASTYCVLVVARVGWDTFAHYDDWKATSSWDEGTERMYLTGRNPTGMQGTLGALSVVALSLMQNYKDLTPSTDM